MRYVSTPVGSHSTYKQLCCLFNSAVLTRGAANIVNELLTQDISYLLTISSSFCESERRRLYV